MNIIRLILLLQIIYILSNNNEIFREKIDHFYIEEDYKNIKKYIFIFFIIIFIIFIIKIKNKLNLIIIILFIYIKVNYKLNSIKYNKYPKYDINELNNLKTGDIVLFRYYKSNDIGSFLITKLLLPLISNEYYMHVGIIVMIDNKPYVLEFVKKKYYCNYSKIKKNGSVLFDASNRLNNYYGRIIIIKNNSCISNYKIFKFMNNYEKYEFGNNNMVCTIYLSKLLYYLKITKYKYIYIPGSFIEKKNYNIKFKDIIELKNKYYLSYLENMRS